MASKSSSTRNNPINSTDLESGVTLGGSGSSSWGKEAEAEARPLRMRVVHRVPPQMRKKKKKKPLFDPSVMSLGPYHHGQPQLRQLEKFKDEMVKLVFKVEERRLLFRSKILWRIDDIRHFYGGLSRDEFDDDVLADMMLRDACALLYFLETGAWIITSSEAAYSSLGSFQFLQALDDMLKLENQIPWWLMKSLISFTYDDDDDDGKKGKEFLRRLFSFQLFGNPTHLKQIPWHENKDEYYPLHYLEATRSIAIEVDKIGINRVEETTSHQLHQAGKRSFRSVRELGAKGIYFKPSSRFLTDVSFTSYSMFGVLRLPVLVMRTSSKAMFSNMIALEMSPNTPGADGIFTSYMTFMKSMIQSPEDVKLLQEEGVIVSFIEDSEEIFRIFKEMETFGAGVLPFYDGTKIRMNQHCDSKSKTWIADLFNTNFSSPWTVVTFLAAAFLLCLTFLQTYYTINPK